MEANEAIVRKSLRHANDPELHAGFEVSFPGGPTPVQLAAWPLIRANRHCLLIAPTGTGKTLASFFVPLDRLSVESTEGSLTDTVRILYVAPLKSLTNDIRKNLTARIADIAARKGLAEAPIRVGVRTGDTSAYERTKLKKRLPHILLTTPESLSILLSQSFWNEALRTVDTLIVDELHALASKRRGSDLALSLERLSDLCDADPLRIGLSATCRPAEKLAAFLVGPQRACEVVDVTERPGESPYGRLRLTVESLIAPDELPYKPLVLDRIVDRLRNVSRNYRTTVVFANTRPMTERLTYLLKHSDDQGGEDVDGLPIPVAAHHGSLDVSVRTGVEESLRLGRLGMVVTSTSLELGVDYPSADYVVQVGSPGSVSRCLQRLGRAGHAPDRDRDGVILAAHPAELATAVITADEALRGNIEPIDIPERPLDVLCQHLVGQACSGPTLIDSFFATVKRSWPYRELSREDFDRCLAYLCGDAPGIDHAETAPSDPPRWTPPRLASGNGRFRLRRQRVARWFRMNVGTIDSEQSVPVELDGRNIGSLESAFADRLVPGDRFVLDGRSLSVRRFADGVVRVRISPGESEIPVWSSQRPGLSEPLAQAVCHFRDELARRTSASAEQAERWLRSRYGMREADARCLVELWLRQMRHSEIPVGNAGLVESYPEGHGWTYAVHASMHRSAAECLGRAFAARIGRMVRCDLELVVSDFGFILRTEAELLDRTTLRQAFDESNLEADVLEGLDRGDLVARQFRQAASTGLMILRNKEGAQPKVGGLDWVSRRLYPTLLESCPDHPLLRQARIDVLERILDVPAVRRWLGSRPAFRFRRLDRMSPFTMAWLDPFRSHSSEPMFFETADDALDRLHDRLFQGAVRENRL